MQMKTNVVSVDTVRENAYFTKQSSTISYIYRKKMGILCLYENTC